MIVPPITGRVLVVDDTPANVSLLLDELTAAGHDVVVAESGRSALSLLQHSLPDLVLLDFVMPEWDGVVTCRRIKEHPPWRDLPVLFMTALDEPAQKLRAFEAGAVDYITKPLHLPEVLARISAHLQIRALQKSLADELALRIEAENQLSQSLDRAVVLADSGGRIIFSTRLAEDLLHKHFPGRQPGVLPPGLGSTPELLVRHFTEPGNDHWRMLILEEPGAPPGPAALLALGVTPREAEVLYWIAQGKSNADIAGIIGASVRTVHKHVEHLFAKLGVESRHAAALAALERLRG